jgi:hypothetical protein
MNHRPARNGIDVVDTFTAALLKIGAEQGDLQMSGILREKFFAPPEFRFRN